MRKHVYTIEEKDVGQLLLSYITCQHCGVRAHINVTDVMGRILPIDVGKRIYKVVRDTNFVHPDNEHAAFGGVYQVENQEQLNKRLQSAT